MPLRKISLCVFYNTSIGFCINGCFNISEFYDSYCGRTLGNASFSHSHISAKDLVMNSHEVHLILKGLSNYLKTKRESNKTTLLVLTTNYGSLPTIARAVVFRERLAEKHVTAVTRYSIIDFSHS